MEVFALLVGEILPYVTIAVFILGLLYRLNRWRKAAAGNMALFPKASGNKGEMRRKVFGEILFFSSFRKENKQLWWSTWLLHASLLLIILGHTRLLTDWPLRGLLGLSEGAVNNLSSWSGGAGGIIALVALVALAFRRLTVRRAREISTGEDYLLLMLLVVIVITGNALRFQLHFDVTVAQAYFASLLTPTAILVPMVPMFLIHFLLVQIMLMYLPFGKLLHVPGIFYSKPLLARDF